MSLMNSCNDPITRYQLPQTAKKGGAILFIFCLSGVFLNRYTIDLEWLRIALRYGMLVGLLIISLSRDSVEDEMVIRLRQQSYAFAFISAVIYSLIWPFAIWGIGYLLDSSQASFIEAGDFFILWLLLVCQVGYFELQKYRNR